MRSNSYSLHKIVPTQLGKIFLHKAAPKWAAFKMNHILTFSAFRLTVARYFHRSSLYTFVSFFYINSHIKFNSIKFHQLLSTTAPLKMFTFCKCFVDRRTIFPSNIIILKWSKLYLFIWTISYMFYVYNKRYCNSYYKYQITKTWNTKYRSISTVFKDFSDCIDYF